MSNKAILKLRLYFLLRPKKSQNKIFLFSQTVFDYFLDLVDLVGQGLLPHVLGQVLLDQLLHLDGVRLLTNISRPLVEQLASTPFLRSKERNQINTSYQKLFVHSEGADQAKNRHLQLRLLRSLVEDARAKIYYSRGEQYIKVLHATALETVAFDLLHH